MYFRKFSGNTVKKKRRREVKRKEKNNCLKMGQIKGTITNAF